MRALGPVVMLLYAAVWLALLALAVGVTMLAAFGIMSMASGACGPESNTYAVECQSGTELKLIAAAAVLWIAFGALTRWGKRTRL